MIKPDTETRLLEEILDTYKMSRPVPEDVRREILASKKKNLTRVLKSVGAFSALHGIFLTCYFALKKLGVTIPVAKLILSLLTAAAVAGGGYYAVTILRSGDVPVPEAAPEAPRRPEAAPRWVDRITLYNGRVIEGAVISRGARYRVRTASGVIDIPRNMIRTVKPLEGAREDGAAR